jgi:hypothetical protein
MSMANPDNIHQPWYLGYKITARTLMNYYKRADYSYSTPRWSFWHRGTAESRLAEQQQWVQTITQRMKDGYRIFWQDETSLSLWERNTKIWHPAEEPPTR